jgi:hypothetical protein
MHPEHHTSKNENFTADGDIVGNVSDESCL